MLLSHLITLQLTNCLGRIAHNSYNISRVSTGGGGDITLAAPPKRARSGACSVGLWEWTHLLVKSLVQCWNEQAFNGNGVSSWCRSHPFAFRESPTNSSTNSNSFINVHRYHAFKERSSR
ncbi:hypothetical protein NE237_017671 [Protea cynaroides]|uniref:Uncharacterized protein n=1 Tax=Protea cynaroides TaxID=273540 RepID=A0A9Q0K8H3_9MAGN|nr:hypothetical protein NE237_017671 [Protea cynaroides]